MFDWLSETVVRYLAVLFSIMSLGYVVLSMMGRRGSSMRSSLLWLVVSTASMLVCILILVRIWSVSAGPDEVLTRRAINTEIDSWDHEMACKIDSLSALIMSTANRPSGDSASVALVREQAECLDAITATALDKAMVAIGLEKYVESLMHLQYALVAAGGDPDVLAKVYYSLGVVRARTGAYELALNTLDSALSYDPTSSATWAERGAILVLLGLYENALASFDSALTYGPGSPDLYRADYYRAWNQRGNVLFELGRFVEAIECYDTTLAYKPDYFEAWYNRGNAHSAMGMYHEALASYDSSLCYSPEIPHVWHNRALALLELGQPRVALLSIERALVYDPNAVVTLRLLDSIRAATR